MQLKEAFGSFAPCALLMAIALIVYRSNDGFLYTYDSAPTSLFVFNLLQHHTFAFDSFRNGYLYAFGAAYVFAEAPNGHLAPIFPIGTALLTSPIYIVDYLGTIAHAPMPDIVSSAFEPARLRYEKDAAAIVGATTAVVFFLCARRLAPLTIAAVATVAFAFGSEMWTIGSQALWQHGAINFTTLAMTYALLRQSHARTARTSATWLFVGGVCAGFLPVVRPTAAAFALAGLAFAYWHRRRQAWPFVAGACAGIAPGIVWNAFVFHSLIGGYGVDAGSFAFTLPQVATALSGLLISPSRGLLVYTPFVLLSIAGAFRAARTPGPDARLLVFLAAACALVVANYAFYESWIGGSSFGPRFLTDLSSVCALLLLYVLPRSDPQRRFNRRSVLAAGAACALVICYGIGVQIAGANGEPKSAWSDIPFDAGQHPERVWQRSDTQIERDALATYRLWHGSPTFSNVYPAGFHGRVLDVRRRADTRGREQTLAFAPVVLAPNETVDLTASVENTGSSRWYGYTSGVYFGQARVRARIYRSDGHEVAESYLYIAGSPPGGERVFAAGTFRAPPIPGTYVVAFDVDCFQVAAVSGRIDAPAFRAKLSVR